MSSCHHVIMSSCHHVIMSSCLCRPAHPSSTCWPHPSWLTWMLTWPDWLRMSTPAGASSDMEEVVLSRTREWPAGDRTAFVARLSLGNMMRMVAGWAWSHLTETPAWDDTITLSDPITVSRPELENRVFLLESVTTILSALTRNPDLSERWLLCCRQRLELSPSRRSVWMFLFLLLMLTEKFPSDTSLRGTRRTDDILNN